MLGFDAEGRLERAVCMRQSPALAELIMDRVIPRSGMRKSVVVDAGSRFVAKAGRWQPLPALEREILGAGRGVMVAVQERVGWRRMV